MKWGCVLNLPVLEVHELQYIKVVNYVFVAPVVQVFWVLSIHVVFGYLSLGMERFATAAPVGNSTWPSWCSVAKSTARCWSFTGNRLMVNSTLNFIFLMKVCNNLKETQKVRETCGFHPFFWVSRRHVSLDQPLLFWEAQLHTVQLYSVNISIVHRDRWDRVLRFGHS